MSRAPLRELQPACQVASFVGKTANRRTLLVVPLGDVIPFRWRAALFNLDWDLAVTCSQRRLRLLPDNGVHLWRSRGDSSENFVNTGSANRCESGVFWL